MAPLVPIVATALAVSTVTATVIVYGAALAVSFGLSIVSQKFLKKDADLEPVPPGGTQLDVRVDADIPRAFLAGRAVTAGTLIHAATYGKNPGTEVYATVHNTNLIEMFAVSDKPVTALVDVFVEGQEVTYTPDSDPDRGQVLTSPTVYDDKIAFKFYDGTQVAADAFSVDRLDADTERPWTNDHIGYSVAYLRAHYIYSANKVPGRLRWKAVYDGIPLYDPRLDTTVGGSGSHRFDDISTHEWSDNPAVFIYNIVRGIYVEDSASNRVFLYGLQNTSAASCPLDVWFAAMNECDVLVSVGAGSSPTGTEKQYRFGGEISVDTPPLNTIEEVLKTCGGRFNESGGTYKLIIGAPGLPIHSITDGDIIADQDDEFDPILGLEDRTNYVTATYTSPEEGWIPKVAPARSETSWEVEDGRRLSANIDAPMVQSQHQIQRLMKQYLMRSRQQRKHNFHLPRKFFRIEPGDVIEWDSDLNGYIGKLFEVDMVQYYPDMSVQVAVTEVDAADYDWTPSTDTLSNPNTLPVALPPDPKVVTGFAVTGFIAVGDQGTERAAILLEWDDPVDGDVLAVQWQIRLQSDATNVSEGQTSNVTDERIAIIGGLQTNTTYELRARFLSANNYEADWTSWLPVTTPVIEFDPAEIADELVAKINSIEGLAQLVGFHSQLIVQQNDLLIGTRSQVDDATAEGTFRIITDTAPGEAISAITMQVKSSVAGQYSSAGFQMISYATADGAEESLVRITADHFQVGQEDETGGDFISIFEIGNYNGMPQIVLRADAIRDDGVSKQAIVTGALTTIIPFDDANQTRDFNAWDNSGAGEEFSTLNFALSGDGVVIVECFLLIDTASALVNATGHFISIEANGVEILNRTVGATILSAANGHFSLCVAVSDLPAGTNQLVGKLRLNDIGTGGSNNATVSNIRWIVTEHHKPAVQAGGAVAAAVTYRTAQSAAGVNTMTLSTVAIGTAAANRRVVVGVGLDDAAVNVTSVTIQGIAAERIINRRVGTTAIAAQIWAATVPAGTTADVVIGASGFANELSAAVWTVTTAAEAPADFASDVHSTGGNPVVEDAEIQSGGVAIVFCWGRDTSAFTGSWTGADAVTEAVESAGAVNTRYAGYHFLTTESTTDDDFTFGHGASTDPHVAVMATWR